MDDHNEIVDCQCLWCIVFTRVRQALNDILRRIIFQGMLEESKRLERLCTNTQNCSERDLQFLRIFPSNADTSSLGSITIVLSVSVAMGPGELLDARSKFFISREQSNTSFSTLVCDVQSSSHSFQRHKAITNVSKLFLEIQMLDVSY